MRNRKIENLKKEWEERGEELGSSKRAVLFKRFPRFLNEYIHKRHIKFCMRNIPEGNISILDVGCGYGRVSSEILHASTSEITFQGVELSTVFAKAYQENIGSCFNGPVQDFTSNKTFDSVVIVTLLMYLEESEQQEVLVRLWELLKPGGVLICIEPAVEFNELWRKITRTPDASPTGGKVGSYVLDDLVNKVNSLSGIRLKEATSISLFGLVPLHHCVAVEKKV
jgi:SAM-dependent methyltransferase